MYGFAIVNRLFSFAYQFVYDWMIFCSNTLCRLSYDYARAATIATIAAVLKGSVVLLIGHNDQ